jgi:hypothetical protein
MYHKGAPFVEKASGRAICKRCSKIIQKEKKCVAYANNYGGLSHIHLKCLKIMR